MRGIVFSLVIVFGTGFAGFAQDSPGTLRGVYGPPGSPLPTTPSRKPTLSAPNYGALDSGPTVTVPGTVGEGQAIPSSVSPTPIPDRPGYGVAVVNGRRAIIDLNTNRIFQYLN